MNPYGELQRTIQVGRHVIEVRGSEASPLYLAWFYNRNGRVRESYGRGGFSIHRSEQEARERLISSDH